MSELFKIFVKDAEDIECKELYLLDLETFIILFDENKGLSHCMCVSGDVIFIPLENCKNDPCFFKILYGERIMHIGKEALIELCQKNRVSKLTIK